MGEVVHICHSCKRAVATKLFPFGIILCDKCYQEYMDRISAKKRPKR